MAKKAKLSPKQAPPAAVAAARKSRIVVAGDVCVDWLRAPVPAQDPVGPDNRRRQNWQLYDGLRLQPCEGGAILQANLVAAATGAAVLTHRMSNLWGIQPDKVLISTLELDLFPKSPGAKDKVYRVRDASGFAGPLSGAPPPLPIDGDDPLADIVVLDDAGNGFRDAEDTWPQALTTAGRKPLVVHKMSCPVAAGKLWDLVLRDHADRTVVVVRADHLREIGVDISRRLSWERTALDFAWQISSNPALAPLARCAQLVVLFGIDGAILHTPGRGAATSRLYYDPMETEEGFCSAYGQSHMVGLGAAFTAGVVARVASSGLADLGAGVCDGIQRARRMFLLGFGPKGAGRIEYQVKDVFGPLDGKERQIASVAIPQPVTPENTGLAFWSILNDLSGSRLEDVAYDIVRRGFEKAIVDVPVGRFRNLKTVDRTEIESFCSIRNLMREYLEMPATKPLSIGVFGPPGSGKSFGVTEVAESVKEGFVRPLEFNVSQFRSPDDLAAALHQVRDVLLGGKVPLVFFDEFDARLDGQDLGWLRFFLMPMQDGKFRDGETEHPVGQAIFVFAGGTRDTFQEFACEELPSNGNGSGDAESRKAACQASFRAAKGPDFVSRLRGYVNVLGPNPRNTDDTLCMIRRAIMLRFQLQRRSKDIFDNHDFARIDEGVLRALIKVPRYKHGVRSMEAILGMSMLAGHSTYEQSSLPPAEQLDLHVDAKQFQRLVVRDALFGAARDKIAQAIHDDYRKGKKGANPAALRSWDTLAEDYREANRLQADDIPEKLRLIGRGFAPVAAGREPALPHLEAEEIERLAKLEHERWCNVKARGGWTCGLRDDAKKQNPCLMPWEKLPEVVKNLNRRMVANIPVLLARAGFEIYRLGPKAR